MMCCTIVWFVIIWHNKICINYLHKTTLVIMMYSQDQNEFGRMSAKVRN